MPGTNLNSAMTANSTTLWIREVEPVPTGPDSYAYAISATCTGAPPTTANLFRNGCNMIRLDSTGNVNYQNTGTTSVPVWSVYDTAAGGLPPLTTGKIWEGVANVATEKTLGATFAGGSNTTSATSGGTPAGTVAAPVFTGSASVLNLASPVFSGTGQSSAGQVITTTDNQTMTLNQCAGMWFVSATHGPYLIASNTAVVGAPAVLTIIGTAPTTDAGIYKIVANIPVGTNSAPAFTGSALSTHTHTVTPTGTVTPTYT